MKRRGFLAGLAVLLPGAALAQQPMMPPPDGMAPQRQQRPPRPQRPRPADLSYEQLNPKQRQRIAQVLAGPGAPPLPPMDAQQRWDSMTPMDRRGAMRAYRQATQPQGGRSLPPQQ